MNSFKPLIRSLQSVNIVTTFFEEETFYSGNVVAKIFVPVNRSHIKVKIAALIFEGFRFIDHPFNVFVFEVPFATTKV